MDNSKNTTRRSIKPLNSASSSSSNRQPPAARAKSGKNAIKPRGQQSASVKRAAAAGQLRAKAAPAKSEGSFAKAVKKKFSVFSIRSGMDMPFFFLVLILVVIGLVMLFSASYPYAYYYYNDSYFFIKSQIIWAVIGVAVMIALSYFDYHHLHKFAIPALILSFVLLVVVLMLPAYKEVHRWIRLGGLPSIQPSEIAKFAIVLTFAHLISINFKRMSTFRYGILPYVVILAPTLGLLALEPHLSCAIIVVLLGAGMLFIGGVKLRWFGGALAAVGAVFTYMIIFTNNFSYANARLAAWLDPFTTDSALRDYAWQTKQSLYSIGSGGLLGLGLGNSRQKYLYVPEPQNDFIFSIVCEELGFIGALIIIILFALLVWRGITISMKAKDKFGALLGIGLTAQVGLQMLLNVAVITNTIPNTGISLPFFSYGGSSLVMLLAQMGIVLSISRTATLEKT